MEVYNNPKYYELAFSFRDIPKEVDFLEKLIAKHSKIPVKTFLELASGNSPHLIELCRRGYQYIGLELNPEMVDYARSKIKENSLAGEIVQADMIQFALTKSADCALVFLGSLYVKNDDDLKKHLNSVAHSLKSGGLYILDGVVSYYPEDAHTQSWDMERGSIKMTVTYKAAWINETERLLRGTITLDIQDGNGTKKIEHSEIKKIYSHTEFVTKAEQTGDWEEVGSFSNFDINNPPKEGARNILILRRK